GGGRQPELAHRVGDAALHRLEAIAPRPQRAIEDHLHRIIEVRFLAKHTERAPFHTLEIHRRLRHQISTSALSPLLSSQSRRSPARFFASIMSISLSVWSLASMVSCTRRRVRGSIVVSRSCGGFISPRPLKRVTTGLVRARSSVRRLSVASRSWSSSAYSTCLPASIRYSGGIAT